MTPGSTAAGWYDDGRGSQRWWDGTAWTDHVAPSAALEPAISPMPAPSAPAALVASAPPVPAPPPATPPPSPSLAPPTVALPAALARPAAPPRSPGATWPAQFPDPPQVEDEPVGEPGPRTRAAQAASADKPASQRPAYIGAAAAALLLAAFGGYVVGQSTNGGSTVATSASPVSASPSQSVTALAGAGLAPTTPSAGAPSGPATAAVSPVPVRTQFFGVPASALAAQAACAVVPSPKPTASPVTVGPKPVSTVDCTINGTSYQLTTWRNAGDQNAAATLIQGLYPYLPPGRHYYAAGRGYTGFDTNDTLEGAQTLVRALGGRTVEIVKPAGASPTPSKT
jgi:hypothetical protein